MNKIVFLLILASSILIASENDSSGVIILEMANFKNDNGKVRVSLFQSKEGFPEDFKKAYTFVTQSIENNKAEVIFEDIPYGEYAIGFLHDENLDGELNTNWLGMPKEGIAASNNAKGRFGPPSFNDSKFLFNSDSLKQVIEIINP